MSETITTWYQFISHHVPTVTWIGLSMAAVFGVVYLAKRYKECALLGGVCAAYAVTPYLSLF